MTSRPIRYRPIQRHWYRLLDVVQPVWHRFRASRTGRFTTWLLPRLLRVATRLAMWLAVAVVIVGTGVLFVTLSFVTGRNSLLNMRAGARR